MAAGSLLDLDAARMRDALGSAGTQAAGVWEFNSDGSMNVKLEAIPVSGEMQIRDNVPREEVQHAAANRSTNGGGDYLAPLS